MLGATILSVLLLLLMVKCEESPGVEPQNPRNLEPIPNVETLNRHQFEILEQCLYYYLAAEAQRKAQYFNAIQALSAFPPEAANARGSRVKLFFHQITLQHFVMNEFLKELNINGYISVFWDDSRLSWNEEHWKLKKMEINSVNHIWIPMLTAQT
ncbi:unnamed protein product [Brugia pahangi]|uniref:Neur_chan_LBD domain-containing protein n=1 Tax=Brugia pahangi TaxID=6280 RepID=A0A0N4T7E7_BRUPA|nr:unnamed protein product [Brugia pahangi]